MCMSTVFREAGGRHEEVMRDVAWMKAQKDGFLLINLFGEQIFVRGKIKHLDFVDEHSVVIEDDRKET